ncbi:MAG: hypothetical protein VKJ46_15520 [Leptolyngbyaceae bacterium]|nr:hypothetical protein [Leptolyngbyaceae bacterium]
MPKKKRTSLETNAAAGLMFLLSLFLVLSFLVSAILALWPLLLTLGIAGSGLWWWNRDRQIKQHHQRFLQSTFYRLITENQGRMTVLEFAMQANIIGSEAKQYLDLRAEEFSPTFEVTHQGEVVYCFPTVKAAQSMAPIRDTHNPAIASPDLDLALHYSLSQAELAKRLDLSPSRISSKKSDPDFGAWSSRKDPEGISWQYSPETQRFHPAVNPQ